MTTSGWIEKKSSPTNKLDTIILSPTAIVSVIALTTVLHESNPTHTYTQSQGVKINMYGPTGEV